MAVDVDGLDGVSDDALLAAVPDRPIASLRDVEVTYGALYTLGTVGEDAGEYAAYLTPSEAEDLYDEDALIVVRADVSGDEPSYEGVEVRRLSRDLASKVAHCRNTAPNGMDHSITHLSGQDSSPEKLARYAADRLAKWPTDDIVQEAALDADGGDIVLSLARLGGDEDAIADLRRDVENAVGEMTALVTVQVRVEPDGEWQWPGDIEAFLAAMKRRRDAAFRARNQAENATGTAVCQVTGEETTVVGTVDDPLRYYKTKQVERFPAFDADESWRTHPVSRDAALKLDSATEFLDACHYSTLGARVYYLPYFKGRPSADRLRLLYEVLANLVNEDGEMSPLARAYRHVSETDADAPLRFYCAVVDYLHYTLFDSLGEANPEDRLWPVDLADAHKTVLDSDAFGLDGAFPVAASYDTSQEHRDRLELIDDEISDATLVDAIATGRYLYRTFPERETDADADDPRIRTLVDVLSGRQVARDRLLANYVERLLDAEGGDYGFPRDLVAQQFAQMQALAVADLLEQPDELTDAIPTMTDAQPAADMDDQPASDATSRERREANLKEFLDDHPALRDNHERRAAFTLGALVGHLSNYQERKEGGPSATLMDNHSIKSLTKNNVKRVTSNVLHKNSVYASEAGYGGMMFGELTADLTDTMETSDPRDWELSLDDLRFHYSLGIAYGLNGTPASDD